MASPASIAARMRAAAAAMSLSSSGSCRLFAPGCRNASAASAEAMPRATSSLCSAGGIPGGRERGLG